MKTLATTVAMVLLLTLAGNASAAPIIPSDPDLQDLPHGYYFTWGLDWEIPEGETIISASLTFKKIYNWTEEDDDILWVHLLQGADLDVHRGDDDHEAGSYFNSEDYAGEQILLNAFDDLPEGRSNRANVVYNFDYTELTTLIDYSMDGNWGIGFDPDCHFYNRGIELRIETAPVVPEPATWTMLLVATAGLAGWTRRRFLQK